MINFFRKIRRILLEKGSLTKYLIYASGEIILVVIGILIALQINSWKEGNEDRKWEKQFLTDLEIELRTNLSQLQSTFEIQEMKGNDCIYLIELVHQNDPNTMEEVDSIFHGLQARNPTFFPTTGVYDSGLAAGKIENIQNDSLKYMIMNLYNHYFERLVYNGTVLDQVVETVDWEKRKMYSSVSGTINSWEATQNPDFSSMVSHLLDQNKVYRRLASNNLEQMSIVIDAVEAENDGRFSD